MEELLSDQIGNLISPFLEEMGVELVDLKIYRHRGNAAIAILADKEFGGITIEECSTLNRRISMAMEAQNILNGFYTLEVSSPGLDRPLRTAKDLRRARQREARFFLSQPVAGKLEHAGTIEEVNNENVLVRVNDQMISIPIHLINKAKQVIQEGNKHHGK